MSADQAHLHLCWKDSTAMLSWGHSQTHPSSPQGSRPPEERNKELQQASWPISEADPACTPSLPQDQRHRQAVGVTGQGWRSGVGTAQSGKQGKSVVHFASQTPARQSLTGQRDRATGGQLVFQRFPACHLLWLLPSCRPGQRIFESSGDRGSSGSMLTALSPRHSDNPPCTLS